jgi:hypothetical protein
MVIIHKYINIYIAKLRNIQNKHLILSTLSYYRKFLENLFLPKKKLWQNTIFQILVKISHHKNHYFGMFKNPIIWFAPYFTFGYTYGWETFPKCRAKLISYKLIQPLTLGNGPQGMSPLRASA